VPRLDRLSQVQRTMLLARPVEVNRTAPWTPPPAPLAAMRLALVTTAGLHLLEDRPFARDDPSYRVIPSSAGPSEIRQSHSSLAFDRRSMMRDLNVVFPVDRLREMVKEGAVASLGRSHYSFMGALSDVDSIRGPAAIVADELLADGVQTVLLTPT
jgi:D-proline reductase (dithiol) PrdB